ncbi:MAG TPA: ATP-binding protein [Terriglobales bacterium]|nr:ATP-binding protein [Terriglobales bacterium]
MQRLLDNPQFMRIAITAAIGTFFFLLILIVGFVLYRKLRTEVRAESLQGPTRISEDNSAFSLAAYEGVIRKLKDQEKELERLRKSERDRAYESASMSEAVLSNLGSGVLLFSPASLVRQANPAARSLLGYASPTGLHARDAFRGVSEVRFPVLPPGDISLEAIANLSGSQCLVSAVEQAMKLGLSFRRLEADYRTPDSTHRVLGVTISPVKGATGDIMGAAVLLSDLTEITHLGRQVRLRENMAALGEMSAGIAHEFKNSLATISGYAQMLSADAASGGALYAGKIADETAALARIVNDFLNFARPQGFAQEPVDLAAVLGDCAEECHVRLETTAGNGPWTVVADPTALRQAFSNLLRNSAEAVTEGQQPIVRVDIAEGPPPSYSLRVTLRDNGGGIPPEVLPHVFVPFYTTKPTGTGLGLALVHRIITEQGGTIQVESTGAGATFTLTLPRPKNAAISG